MLNTLHNHLNETQTPEQFLARWFSTAEVYSHAVAVLRHHLPQAAKLVEDSTKIMSERFGSLAADINKQSEIASQIAELSNSISVGNEQISVEEFNELFSHTLSDSIEKILFVSKRAITMVYTLDEAMKSIASIENFVVDIHNITKKANLLALNASIEAARAGEAGKGFMVVAGEVKEVSNTIREISESINSRINAVRDGVKEGYDVLKDVATTDMSQTIMAQDKLSALMTGMIEQKNKFSSVLKESAAVSKEASNTLSGMVVNLQFQDRTSQYVDGSIKLLEFMERAVARVKADNIDVFPSLTVVGKDDVLIDEVRNQFKLSEFARSFESSISGRHFTDDLEHSDIGAIINASDDVELF